MVPIYPDITRTTGDTPAVKLNVLSRGIDATILAKMEFRNPLGSVKDRIGVAMIDAAEKKGSINRL
jgi:cysteine synthase A